jgi:hypothetical protein
MGARGGKKKGFKLRPYIGINKQVRMKGFRKTQLYAEFKEKYPEVKLSQQSFYNFILGIVCTTSRELVLFMSEKLEMTVDDLMVHYVSVGMTRSEFERAKLETPEMVRKKQEYEEIEAARKKLEDNPDMVKGVFKQEGNW